AWSVISLVPFVVAVLRYAVDVDSGNAGEPEEIALHDRVLQVLGGAWVVLLVLGCYLYAGARVSSTMDDTAVPPAAETREPRAPWPGPGRTAVELFVAVVGARVVSLASQVVVGRAPHLVPGTYVPNG